MTGIWIFATPLQWTKNITENCHAHHKYDSTKKNPPFIATPLSASWLKVSLLTKVWSFAKYDNHTLMNACHALVCHAQPVGTPNYRGFDGAELPSCFVYIVYVFATIVVHFRLLFNPSIFNISPPPFIPKLLGNLSSIASFFTFLKSHLILITPLYGPSVSFLTPPLLSQNWNEKKVPDFFSAQIRENNPNNILEVFQSTILDALVCGWNPRRMENQVGPGDWKTRFQVGRYYIDLLWNLAPQDPLRNPSIIYYGQGISVYLSGNY